MGKGTIISGGTDGQYQVSVVYNTDRAAAEKSANLAKIANLESQIASETDDRRLNVLILQKLSLEKRNAAIDSIPESETISAWCADLTEDLTGNVGLIEVPGESVAFNIQPGHEDNAAYDATRDGQIFSTMAMTPAAAFYNLAMLPGWQKWKPTFRYGTISAISGDTASVTLEAATSTQQSLGVNQASTLTDVPVEYMSCNGAAFEVGDEVLVKFTGQDWSSPVIIGFKDNPAACTRLLIKLLSGSQVIIFDQETNAVADDVPLDSDPSTMATFPCAESEISNWLALHTTEKNSPLSDTTLSRFDLYENHPSISCPAYEDWTGPDCWGDTLDCSDTGLTPVLWTYDKDVYTIQDEFRAKRETDISKKVYDRGLATKELASSTETRAAEIDRTEVYSEVYMFCGVEDVDPCGFCGAVPTYYEYCLETNVKTFVMKSPFTVDEYTYVLSDTGSSTQVMFNDFACTVLQEEEELDVQYGVDSASGGDSDNPYSVVVFVRKVLSKYRSRAAGKFPTQFNDVYYSCRASQDPFLTPEPAPSWSSWADTEIDTKIDIFLGEAAAGSAGETLNPFGLSKNTALENAVNLFTSPVDTTVTFIK